MSMTAQAAADALDGNQYGNEGSRDLFKAMADARLVAVYGASDDIMMLNGAIHDEFYDEIGIIADGSVVKNGEEWDVPDNISFDDLKAIAAIIKPLWCKEDDISWTYETSIPHATFEIQEDDDIYCRGLVFSLDFLHGVTSV